MPLAQGHRLAHYEILAPIGKGGMGEVFRARDLKLGREVAIKILPASLARDSERLARFEREAKTLASLNHPNVAAIYGIEDSADGPALVMELVPGETLKTPLPMDVALNYFRQIAEALETAHEKGIVHRDLKPGNIMVTPEGVIKVLDFGLAAVAASAEHATDPENSPTLMLSATTPGSIMGTSAYMSPEQASGRAVDRRSDIWSFGVVLWETLSGERLFGGETLSHTLADVLRAPIDFGKLPAETPRSVRELVRRCLDRDVKMRLRDIGEARVALERARAEPEAPELDVARNGRSRLGWIAAAVAAVVAAGLGYVAYRHVAEEPPAVARLELLPPENGVIVTNQGPLAVSPNGRRIVFRANVDGKQMLWVRDLDSPPARMLPGSENATAPFWAPDSRQLAFFTTDLKKIDVTGGSATTVVANTSGGARFGAWNQDDVILFSRVGAGPNLFRVSAAGGTPQPVAGFENASLAWPQFLPDGRHFLYTATSNGPERAIFVGDLESEDRKLLGPMGGNAQYVGSGGKEGYILFVQEGTLMAQPFDAGKLDLTGAATPIAEHVVTTNSSSYGYFGASRNGVLAFVSVGEGIPQQIRWHDRGGTVVGTVGKPVDIGTLRLSPNEKMIATDRLVAQSVDREIWWYDVQRGYADQRLTVGNTSLYPVWSPDSSRIAFVRRPGLVIVKAVDGSGQEETVYTVKVPPNDVRLTMDWTSRDGGFLLAQSPVENPLTGNDIWALPLVGPGPRKQVPLLQTEFAEKHPRVSPDGHWLAYQSNETKRNEVYVVGFPDLKGRRQISIQGGSRPVWSRKDRELYFVSEDNKMMAVEIKPGAQFERGIPKPLFDVSLATANSTYDVSEDGRFLIATPVERTGDVPMTVVLNWQAALGNKKGGLFSRP